MDSTDHLDPVALFSDWLNDAHEKEPDLAEAMTLATADADGVPSARMVLLKDADARGFVFYTNRESRKGGELAANANAALVFHWKSTKRQVRVVGSVELVSEAEADAYFATRARGAQIGAWASEQSASMAGTFDLEKRVAQFTAKFGISTIPRPLFWSGYRVIPHEIEFWEERLFRLHHRLHYQRSGDGWVVTHLFP